MNIQALMKQAQSMQKEVLKAKEEINKMEFIGKSSLVSIIVNGNKEVLKLNIENQEEIKENIELLEDMIVLALNDAFKQIEKMTEQKLGKYASSMSGLI